MTLQPGFRAVGKTRMMPVTLRRIARSQSRRLPMRWQMVTWQSTPEK